MTPEEQLTLVREAMRAAADRYARSARDQIGELPTHAGGLDLSGVIRDEKMAEEFRRLSHMVSIVDIPWRFESEDDRRCAFCGQAPDHPQHITPGLKTHGFVEE